MLTVKWGDETTTSEIAATSGSTTTQTISAGDDTQYSTVEITNETTGQARWTELTVEYESTVSDDETKSPSISIEGDNVNDNIFVDKANVVLSGSDADATYYYYVGSEAKTDYRGIY